MKTPEELVNFISNIVSLGGTQMGGLDGNENHSVYTRKEALLLAKYACQIPYGGTAVEIGVYVGHTASILLNLEPIDQLDLNVVLIDCWSWGMPEAKQSFDLNMANFPNSHYESYWMLSTDAHKQYIEAFDGQMTSIDYLHIDGDHDWRGTGVNNDCDLWLPLLKSGGVVAFHDSYCDGVSRAIAAYCGDWEGERAGRTTVKIKP